LIGRTVCPRERRIDLTPNPFPKREGEKKKKEVEMAKYIIQWNYGSGQVGPYLKGDVVEVEDELAEWMNRDSPGVLKPVKEAKKNGTKSSKAKSDRMLKNPLWDRQGGPSDQGAITKSDFKAIKGD
jgi:hypothetical protein